MTKARANAEYHKPGTAGQPIVITCYGCQTRTLRYDEQTHAWTCTRCRLALTTAEAIDRIAAEISGAEWLGACRLEVA